MAVYINDNEVYVVTSLYITLWCYVPLLFNVGRLVPMVHAVVAMQFDARHI